MQLAHYYRALDQDPHWQGAHFGLGEVAFHREKLDAATQEYHRELEVNPGSAASLARLAEIALLARKARRRAAFIQLCDSRLGVTRQRIPWACRGPTLPRAKTSAKPGKRNCAPACPRWKRLRPVLLAAWPWHLSRRASATRMHRWRRGMISPTTRPVPTPSDAYARGLDNFNRQNFEKAASDLNAWLKLHPNDGKADYLLARTYRNLSLSTLEHLLATAPDSYAAHELLARDLPKCGAGRQGPGGI